MNVKAKAEYDGNLNLLSIFTILQKMRSERHTEDTKIVYLC